MPLIVALGPRPGKLPRAALSPPPVSTAITNGCLPPQGPARQPRGHEQDGHLRGTGSWRPARRRETVIDETRTGLDHLSFGVTSRADVDAWVTRLEAARAEYSRITTANSIPGAVAAAQSWRVSRSTGNCRVVLAWCSPRVGYSATSFGHISARAPTANSSARTVNVWAPTSTVILGLALTL